MFWIREILKLYLRRHVEVESDYKTLEIIHGKNINNASKRLQKTLLRQTFDYHVNYKKGTAMYVVHTLSRRPKGKSFC